MKVQSLNQPEAKDSMYEFTLYPMAIQEMVILNIRILCFHIFQFLQFFYVRLIDYVKKFAESILFQN